MVCSSNGGFVLLTICFELKPLLKRAHVGPFSGVAVLTCSGQLIPDTALIFSSATAGAKPSLN